MKFLGFKVRADGWTEFERRHAHHVTRGIEVETDGAFFLCVHCKRCQELYVNAPEEARALGTFDAPRQD